MLELFLAENIHSDSLLEISSRSVFKLYLWFLRLIPTSYSVGKLCIFDALGPPLHDLAIAITKLDLYFFRPRSSAFYLMLFTLTWGVANILISFGSMM